MPNSKELRFCAAKMRIFAKQDRLLGFVTKDLQKRGHEEELALRATFNSYVLGDSAMQRIYKTLKVEV